MLASLSNIKASPPKSSLPKELEIILSDIASSSTSYPPTHMLAVHAASTPSAASGSQQKPRQVTLFPTHSLVLAAHCANLPILPAGSAPIAASATTASVPVVPLCLPAPEAFPLLQSYLYTKSPSTLRGLFAAPSASEDALVISRRAMMIHAMWRNACALGVVDTQLYDIIDSAWEGVVSALSALHTASL